MNCKKVKALIFDETYSFISDEPEDQIYKSAVILDQLMRTFSVAGVVNREKITILAAMHLANKLLKLESSHSLISNEYEKLINIIDIELKGATLSNK